MRSTHGANCTGSCSWKIYVKGGIVTWETQQTDYPRTRPDLPNHEPRGCSRGASYSWYLYSGNRVKYPLVRSRLLKLWREARAHADAGRGLGVDRRGPEEARGLHQQARPRRLRARDLGRGHRDHRRRQRLHRQDLRPRPRLRLLADPGHVDGLATPPARAICRCSAASACRSTTGIATCRRPRPQTWGEQTDVPEIADWYNSGFLILWGSNVPQTRTPDAHFYTEVALQGRQERRHLPGLFGSLEVRRPVDLGEAGHRRRARHGHGPRHPARVLHRPPGRVFRGLRPAVHRHADAGAAGEAGRRAGAGPAAARLRLRRQPGRDQQSRLEDGRLSTRRPRASWCRNGSVGFRWGEKGKWNLEEKETGGRETNLQLSFADDKDELADVAFPYFGNREHDHFAGTDHPSVLVRKVPAKRVQLKDGEALVASVFDLFVANYGVDRGFGGAHVAKSYDENVPYTPAWAEKISGVPRDQIIQTAREFARNAEKTNGRSMIIIGAAMNHWFHCDMNYRGVINMLVMCGCVGQSGGGWSHYVGQEKLRPQSGWLPLAFGLDWSRPPRQQNSTSFFYAHTDQWRYETLDIGEIISPTAPAGPWDGALIDYNVRAERMGWLPSAPQLETNPLELSKKIAASGKEPKDYVAGALKSGELKLSCHDPDNPKNWPRNMFVWRSNLLGSSGKGHEYFLKHLLGTSHGVMGKQLGEMGAQKPTDVVWHDEAPGRKARPARHPRLPHVDHLRLLRHRAADRHLVREERPQHLRHASLHPPADRRGGPSRGRRAATGRSTRRSPRSSPKSRPRCWASRRTWCSRPSCTTRRPRSRRPLDVKDWKRGECEPVAGKTMPAVTVVERDYPNLYKRFTSLGPAHVQARQRRQGHGVEYRARGRLPQTSERRRHGRGADQGAAQDRDRHRRRRGDPDAGARDQRRGGGQGLGRRWAGFTGREHTHLAVPKEDEKIRFRDVVAQPRKIISSPIWSS